MCLAPSSLFLASPQCLSHQVSPPRTGPALYPSLAGDHTLSPMRTQIHHVTGNRQFSHRVTYYVIRLLSHHNYQLLTILSINHLNFLRTAIVLQIPGLTCLIQEQIPLVFDQDGRSRVARPRANSPRSKTHGFRRSE